MKNIHKYNQLNNKIGSIIIQLRKENKMNREQLSQEIGIHFNTLRYYEIGERAIPAIILNEIARKFNVPMELFFENGMKEYKYIYLAKITVNNEEFLIPVKNPTSTKIDNKIIRVLRLE